MKVAEKTSETELLTNSEPDINAGEITPESPFDVTDNPGRSVPAIEFHDVHLSFDDKKILDGLSFIIRKGETKIVLCGSCGGYNTIINLDLGRLYVEYK